MTRTLSTLMLLAGLTALPALAEDWTCFRGPNGSGCAPEANVPTSWCNTNNLHWKTALPGRGSSSPIISGERVFVPCYSAYDDSDFNATPAVGGNQPFLRSNRFLYCIQSTP